MLLMSTAAYKLQENLVIYSMYFRLPMEAESFICRDQSCK